MLTWDPIAALGYAPASEYADTGAIRACSNAARGGRAVFAIFLCSAHTPVAAHDELAAGRGHIVTVLSRSVICCPAADAQPAQVAAAQVLALQWALGGNVTLDTNARPMQPLHNRKFESLRDLPTDDL